MLDQKALENFSDIYTHVLSVVFRFQESDFRHFVYSLQQHMCSIFKKINLVSFKALAKITKYQRD